jgi:solute carrier family 25 iron transporter 28/37
MQHEGLHMTIRGINTTVYGAGPAHALYFACYEKIKAVLSRANHSNHIAHGVAGCCATVLHDAVMTPTDVVKQRMQVYNSPYKSCLDCIRTVQRTEGIHAFYRSYWTQLLMNIPFVSLHFIVYESMQDTINPGRHYNPRTHVLSGAMAGAVAAAVTTPLDVCKTLLNTQSIRPAHGTAVITGLLHAFATVYRVRGMRGYFSGMTARVLFQAPSTAISWSVYEFFKFIITTRGHHHGEGKSTGGAITASVVVPVGVAASTD